MMFLSGSKREKYLALVAGLLLFVGVGSLVFLNSGQSDTSFEDGPPVLEENTALKGTLEVAGDRYFNVETKDLEGDALFNYASKAPSNFLIFTTPKSDQQILSQTVAEVAEDLLVDDGNSGYVLGTFKQNSWHLYPPKNYLGAKSLAKDSNVEACTTYFVIKIDDQHNSANGFDTANKWTPAERSKIAFDNTYFQALTAGTTECSASDRPLMENGWNIVTVDFKNAADAFVGDVLQSYDDLLAVWDTSVINQIDRVNNSTTNANTRIYVKSGSTFDKLSDYFSGNMKTAGIFDGFAQYDNGKQDLWIYVGSKGGTNGGNNGSGNGGTNPGDGGTDPSEDPKLTSFDRVVNLNETISAVVKESIAQGKLTVIEDFVKTDLPAPTEYVYTFDNVTDVANLEDTSSVFDYNFDGANKNIFVTSVGKSFMEAGLSIDARSTAEMLAEVRLNEGSVIDGNAKVTYQWDNKCTQYQSQIETHVQALIKDMVVRGFESNPSAADDPDFVNKVKEAVKQDIANSLNDAKFAPFRDEMNKYVDELLLSAQIVNDYLENPPYLTSTCGGGIEACAQAGMCQILGVWDSPYGVAVSIGLEKMVFGSDAEKANEGSTETGYTVDIGNYGNYEGMVFEDTRTESAVNVSENDNSKVGSMAYCQDTPISGVEEANRDALSADVLKAVESDARLSVTDAWVAVDLAECANVLKLANKNNGSYGIADIEFGKVYELDSQVVFLRDAYDTTRNTQQTHDTYAVVGSDGVMIVLFVQSSEGSNLAGYDGFEFYLGDGVLWYEDQDLDGTNKVLR